MEFLGLCCGCPVLIAVIAGLLALWRKGARLTVLLGGNVATLFVGLAVSGIVRYVVLEEGVVMDACEGDVASLRWRLDHGGAPDARTDDGLGALECAARNGRFSTARLLLERGADPDAKPAHEPDISSRKTPRDWALASQSPDLIRLFARYPKRNP